MKPLVGCLIAVAAVGCGTETDDRPASFAYITAAILRPSCATAACHSGQNRAAGLILDEADLAYQSLESRIAPCDFGPGECDLTDRDLRPALYLIITDPPEGIERMPIDSPLPDADVELIGRWLVAGAENN